MGRKCKCKKCGSILNTDTAYLVSKEDKKYYYCSEKEYKELIFETDKKTRCFEVIAQILKIPFVPPVMIKEINILNSFYDYEVIKKTFNYCENSISWALQNKTFNSEYNMYKYILSIIKNNINSINIKYKTERSDIKINNNGTNIEIDIINLNTTESNSTDISNFLD